MTKAERYFDTRFKPDPRRDRVWQRIVSHLKGRWSGDAAIVDVGAGYCSFINNVRGRRRVAVDLHADLERYAEDGVETMRLSATDLSELEDASFDVVFASNLLEHLTREEIAAALAEFHRVLRPGGQVILLQPNYRLAYREYWDDYTHLTPLSDRSLGDLLAAAGFDVRDVQARFLPLTIRGSGGNLSFLIPLYLRLPVRPLAKQMLLIGVRGAG
jgi:SAM-dependent methyltransferase